MRENGSLHVDLASTSTPSLVPRELPPIAALFVITFDIKAGYTITWKKTAPGVSLDGVEFKSLPSGLHNLDEDLVYFVHPPYAGVSAFIKVPAPSASRNALMLSLGILVPLTYGRLGRSWRHAHNLISLASTYAASPLDPTPLEQYFALHHLTDTPPPPTDLESPAESPSSLRYRPAGRFKPFGTQTRVRSVSDTAALCPPGQALSPHHPALSLRAYVDLFGPLIFPLYRAALMRRRILLVTAAPVALACNFVYDLSILSNIPLSAAPLLSTDPLPLRPLFSVGIHDIPTLSAATEPWAACTTDDILRDKAALYDVVVTLPAAHNRRAWPAVVLSGAGGGERVKATQRDLVRYRALRRRLWGGEEEEEGVGARRVEEAVERAAWREIAYMGFMWWASAGEKRSGRGGGGEEEEESESESEDDGEEGKMGVVGERDVGGVEMEIVKYFHGMTGRMLGVMADVVEEGEDEEEVFFALEDLDRLGLDRYSSGDMAFVKEVCRRYFGREASVEEGGWSCCAGGRWC